MAVSSGLLIGSSFVFKKKGLLSSQEGHAAGEGVAYLKSVCKVNLFLGYLVLNKKSLLADVVDRDDYYDSWRAMQFRCICLRRSYRCSKCQSQMPVSTIHLARCVDFGCSLVDSHGCTLSGCLCPPIAFLLGREALLIRLDLLNSMPLGLSYSRSQRSERTKCQYHYRIPQTIRHSVVPYIWRCCYCTFDILSRIRCTKVGSEEHAAL